MGDSENPLLKSEGTKFLDRLVATVFHQPTAYQAPPTESVDEPELNETDSLRDRLVLAAVNALREGDPVLVIGIGNTEIRLGWVV